MDTENFIKRHDELLTSIGETCTLLDDGKVCSDGLKCDIRVIGYKSAEDFASSNSVFLIGDFFRMLRNLPRDLKWQDISLRLCVENEAGTNGANWKGEILYKECLPVNFAEDWFVKNLGTDGDGERDGFLVFNKHEILKEKYIGDECASGSDKWMDAVRDDYDDCDDCDDCKCECDSDCEPHRAPQKECDDPNCSDDDCKSDCQKGCDDPNCLCSKVYDDGDGWGNGEGMSLKDFFDEFKKAIADRDGRYFFKYSFTDDGKGKVTAKSDVNGVKKAKTFFYAV